MIWSNVDFSLVSFCLIHLRTISLRVPKLLFGMMGLKITQFELLHILQDPRVTDSLLHFDELTFSSRLIMLLIFLINFDYVY